MSKRCILDVLQCHTPPAVAVSKAERAWLHGADTGCDPVLGFALSLEDIPCRFTPACVVGIRELMQLPCWVDVDVPCRQRLGSGICEGMALGGRGRRSWQEQNWGTLVPVSLLGWGVAKPKIQSWTVLTEEYQTAPEKHIRPRR